jgi:hypothetical protein
VLSLSKYERTLKPFQSLPFDKLRANGLERCSPTGFLRQAQDRQGERIEKHASDKLSPSNSGRGRANGLKSGSPEIQKDKNCLRTLILSSVLFLDHCGERADSSTTSISVRTEPVEV